MKFTCETKLLADAVMGVSRAVSSSSSVPVLQGLLLKAEGFRLELTGYDLEMAITTEVEANVLEPGQIVLPAKLLGDMLRSLSSAEVQVESQETLATHIKGGITEYDLLGMNAADFPDLPAPGADLAFELDAAELAAMIGNTLYAVSTDDKKPAHTGELFCIEPGELTLVALDGFRLAIVHHPVVTDREINIVVPAKTAAEVARLLGDCGEAIRVDANNRFVVFSGGGITVMSRLIEGEFLNYKTVVPEGYKTRVVVDVPLFEKAIERSSVIITERLKNPLRVTFTADGIDIRCQTPLGRVSDQLEAEVEGAEVEIGFNYRYLLDALRNSGCDRVVLELSGPLSPVKILPAEGDDFLFLVLPVRFKND
ncbi:DNA polymerase III subunit beta [Ruminococcaceae bacterium OttesenSCG-928-O06]|nr:DNA polymerase III subunit beta [Ruminococcaceae bacterium OttesenSCG-928-O06]